MVARHPNTPQALLVNAVSEPELCRFVAANPSAPENLLKQLAQDNQHEVLGAIATNPSTPASVLKYIASTRAHEKLVAQHPNANGEILQQEMRRLAMDERLSVRKYAAKHPHTPIDILRMWMRSEPQLRVWIAQNPNTPAKVLEYLASLTGFNWLFLAHPNTSVELRQTLMTTFGKSYIESDRLYAAQHPDTPVEILTELTKDKNLEIRSAALETLKKHNI